MRPHTLLMTGATGSFGTALLDRLCADESVEQVHVISRGSAPPHACHKLVLHRGDVTAGASLGLDDDVAARISAQITGIVHAAADTRFTAPASELHRINVDGTANVLAMASRCARLERVCLLSTVYVAGARTGRVLETELPHTAGFVNAYERSKYDMELLAREAMKQIPIAVARLSTVVGSPSPARRAPVAIHQAVRLMYRSLAPMVPGGEDHPVDLVPMDYAARAVARLVTAAAHPGHTYHVCASTDAIPQGELLDLTMEAIARGRPAWRTRAIPRPAVVDLETFELFRRSVDAVGDSVLRDATAVISAFAPQLAYPKVFDDEGLRQALQGSGIERPCVRTAYARMVEQLVEA